MFLAVVVYPKLPSEMSVRSNVVLVWGAVLRMKPLCSLRSAAGPGAPRPAAGTVCLRAPALLLGMLRGWNGSRKGGKSSASLCNKEFIRLYFNKIKLLRNEREKWSFIGERKNDELNIILSKKIGEWTFLDIWLKINFRIHASILK